MAEKNSIDNISSPIACTTIAVQENPDPYVKFSIDGADKFIMGMDNTDSDKFKIAQGGVLGINDRFVQYTTGEQIMPKHSAFLGYLAASVNNKTGAGTPYQLGTNALTELYDQHNDFNTNGTFVAPVDGLYFLCTTIQVNSVNNDININEGVIYIVTTSRTYYGNWNNPNNCDEFNTGGRVAYQLSVIADMYATDTAVVNIVLSGGGSDVVGMTGHATNPFSYFCGYLVC